MLADLKTLYHLVAKPVRGDTHAARLENFYAGQAAGYDRFRQRLLQGRRELWASVPVPDDGIWVDLGGGTAANLELLGPEVRRLKTIYVVDLSPSLLAIAKQRIARNGWTNVELVEADATTFRLPEIAADVVTMSYALTMIPDWFAAVDNASSLLRRDGVFGVVDFYVSRKHSAAGMVRHGWLARSFWPIWFGGDNVFLSPDHLPYLCRRFHPMIVAENTARIPYLPLVRVPYYVFVGKKRR
jgi:S-adenosylmethionine-diacylgycerolhomoserine-N-methlytransferase